MNEGLAFILSCIWFILPAYFSNATPAYFHKKFRKLHPVDFNRNFFDGRPILGAGKTIEGLLTGIFFGMLSGIVQILLQNIFAIDFLLVRMNLTLALLLSVGALLGDMVASFFKRRLGFERGAETPLLDTLDFLIGALLLSSFVVELTFPMYLFLFIITPLVHRIANVIAYRKGMKDVPW